MATFTVFFNDTQVQTLTLDQGTIHIGRDEANDIHIESLAVALAHAVVIMTNGQATIRFLSDNFPLLVNQQKIKETSLNNGDKIGIGKHIIVYSTGEMAEAESEAQIQTQATAVSQFRLKSQAKIDNDAYLQVTTGRHIGRIITLRKAMTKIGQTGDGVAIISKRKEGYFISSLENHAAMKVNDQTIGNETILLQQNDKVELENLIMQFYID